MTQTRCIGAALVWAALALAALPAFADEARLRAVDVPWFRPAEIRLSLPEPTTPWRAFVLDGPPRLVIDTRAALEAPAGLASGTVEGYRHGALGKGWSRIVFDLSRPMTIGRAGAADGALSVTLERASAMEMARAARLAPAPEVLSALVPDPPPAAPGRMRIVLDPGHGGVDPGAIRDGVAEKDIALAFARDLKAALEKTGRYEVLMTRRGDRFVPLDDRVAFARAAGAALFLSLHANTVAQGDVSGAALHMPSQIASDPQSAAMAVLENGSDSRAGATPGPGGDDVTRTLLDMAEPITKARAKAAATEIVAALRRSAGVIRSRPLRSADFRVLRAPDMPSLLLELGFLSNADDLAHMQSPAWRATVATAMTEAIGRWTAADPEFLALMQE